MSTDSLSLVSSLYGPGTVGCWLCTLASVFVTWTLNVDSQRRDSITNDFIAALDLPTIAAGHFFYVLYSAPHSTSSIISTGSLIFHNIRPNPFNANPAPDPDVIRYAAAAEAPLNVCETFATAALVLFTIAAVRGHARRSVCVLIVVLLALSTEVLVFVATPGMGVLDRLTRPFLFWLVLFIYIVTAMGFAAILLVVFLSMPILGIRYRKSDTPVSGVSTEQQQPGLELETLSDEQVIRQKPDEEARAPDIQVLFTILFIPIFLAIIGDVALGVRGPDFTFDGPGPLGSFFFIPKSPVTITELDQAVSLAAGAITLAFSLWDAYKSRLRAAEDREEMNRRVEAERSD